MRVDIMTDIETLGTKSHSTVFQVSAIAFNIFTGDTLSQFNEIIDIETEELVCDGSTLKWWLNTDKELLDALLNNKNSIGKNGKYVFSNFNEWILTRTNNVKDIYLWGNGIKFDNVMIDSQMSKYGIKYPIFYRNDRDVRTLLELASLKSGYTEEEIKQFVTDDNETKHDALDDCRYQIRLCHWCFNNLMQI